MKGFALSDKVKRWDVLVNNAGQQLAEEAPYMAGDLEALGKHLEEARGLIGQAEALKAEAQANTKKLLALVREGERIRSRLGLNLRARLGLDSEGLVRFGFRPRRPVRRRPLSEEARKKRAAARAAAVAAAAAVMAGEPETAGS